jgi:hypothetical protein
MSTFAFLLNFCTGRDLQRVDRRSGMGRSLEISLPSPPGGTWNIFLGRKNAPVVAGEKYQSLPPAETKWKLPRLFTWQVSEKNVLMAAFRSSSSSSSPLLWKKK